LAESRLVGYTVEKQEVGDDMEGTELVLLQQAVDNLSSHIVSVFAEDGAVYELLRTAGNVVFGVEEAVPTARHEVKPASQRIVDGFVCVASRLYNLAQL
jgi:hypothetical protein